MGFIGKYFFDKYGRVWLGSSDVTPTGGTLTIEVDGVEHTEL